MMAREFPNNFPAPKHGRLFGDGFPKCFYEDPPEVEFTHGVLKRAVFRAKHPSLDAGSDKTKTKQRTPIDIENYIKQFENYKEASELKARIKAWSLSKELYPKDKDINGGVDKYFKDEVKMPCAPVPKRIFLVDSGASYHLISRAFLTREERKWIRKAPGQISLTTANGVVTATGIV